MFFHQFEIIVLVQATSFYQTKFAYLGIKYCIQFRNRFLRINLIILKIFPSLYIIKICKQFQSGCVYSSKETKFSIKKKVVQYSTLFMFSYVVSTTPPNNFMKPISSNQLSSYFFSQPVSTRVYDTSIDGNNKQN